MVEDYDAFMLYLQKSEESVINMTKILLVEDDKTIVASLTEFLNNEGYMVRSVSGQAAAMNLLEQESADLVLMDVALAEGNGFSACRAIKAEYSIPVIFLTASGDEFSTVTGFDLGADDYIAKPFRPRELASRIKNVLRLTGNTGKLVKLGDVVVDTEKGTAMKNNKDLFLSALEYRLLLVFINNRGILLTRTQLLESIWDIAGDFVNSISVVRGIAPDGSSRRSCPVGFSQQTDAETHIINVTGTPTQVGDYKFAVKLTGIGSEVVNDTIVLHVAGSTGIVAAPVKTTYKTEIYDISGCKLPVTDENSLPQGIYVIKRETPDGVEVRKVVK